KRLFVDDVGVVGGAVASDVEALTEIRPGVLVDRRMAHDLPAERQVANVVLADLERELFRFGAREEALGHSEGVVDQRLRHAVTGDDEKPGGFAPAGDGTRQRRCPSRPPGARAGRARYAAISSTGMRPGAGDSVLAAARLMSGFLRIPRDVSEPPGRCDLV